MAQQPTTRPAARDLNGTAITITRDQNIMSLSILIITAGVVITMPGQYPPGTDSDPLTPPAGTPIVVNAAGPDAPLDGITIDATAGEAIVLLNT
jgi:hypothetical protein